MKKFFKGRKSEKWRENLCFYRRNSPTRRRSIYKDIVNFLIQVIPQAKEGQFNRRIHLSARPIQGGICNGNCRLESLSESIWGISSSEKSSLLLQAKRWLSNKRTDRDIF